MSKYMYKATGLITENLKKEGVKFEVCNGEGMEVICVNFPVNNGPNHTIAIVSTGNNNAVKICVYGLVSHISDDKQACLVEACNALNCDVRYLKFSLDVDKKIINVDYDVPLYCTDDCLGVVAVEMVARIAKVLNDKYSVLANAIYS